MSKKNTQATQTRTPPVLSEHLPDTYLTMLGWLSSLSREISRIAVLGTPSVSLGEMEKAEIGMWLQIPPAQSFFSSH